MTFSLHVVAVALLALFGTACQLRETCAMDGVACGGDPTGSWSIIANDSCRDPVYRTPPQLTLLNQPKGTAREPPPEPATSDWCSDLVMLPSGTIENFQFPYDTLSVGGGSLIYQPTAEAYTSRISIEGQGAINLTGACLTAFGATPSCLDLENSLKDFAKTLGSFQDIKCDDDNGEGGCSCKYNLVFTAAFSGIWRTDGGVMTHFDSFKRLPSQVDYCVAGDRMKLWGHQRASILDVPGLRTLSMMRMPP